MSNKKELIALKEEADTLGISYSANISPKTLSKRIEDYRAGEKVPMVSIPEDTIEDVEEIPEEVEEKRLCKGLFIWLPASEFTQSKDYSDRHLKAKGLFKED
jgi:hypothetical protein